MKKTGLAALLLMTSYQANGESLELPNAMFQWDAQTYYCESNVASELGTPTLEDYGVQFKELISDRRKLGALIKADFILEGQVCNYEALLEVNSQELTASLKESIAVSSDEKVSCDEGKAVLDTYLSFVEYEAWGHNPFHVTVYFQDKDAGQLCGDGSTSIGIDFIRGKRL